MSKIIDVVVPDIGDLDEVEILEILISEGDVVQEEDSLITVASDKAAMEIPSPADGTIKAIKVSLGDKVSEGSSILTLETSDSATGAPDADNTADASPEETTPAAETAAPVATRFDGETDIQAEVVVLGSGPGGYTAAFRAADLGKQVILIERYDVIGGVCLNVGCIPSKALLHTADIINEAAEFEKHGVSFGKPEINIDKIRAYKEGIIGKLTGGLKQLAKQRKVNLYTAMANLHLPTPLPWNQMMAATRWLALITALSPQGHE